ncbi:hypothetical protein ABZ756_02445 [Mammaliicoccus sciuri]|nr:hypothetical protein [Sporosarcina newyorkensis]
MVEWARVGLILGLLAMFLYFVILLANQ